MIITNKIHKKVPLGSTLVRYALVGANAAKMRYRPSKVPNRTYHFNQILDYILKNLGSDEHSSLFGGNGKKSFAKILTSC
jgi:hypothetical protein